MNKLFNFILSFIIISLFSLILNNNFLFALPSVPTLPQTPNQFEVPTNPPVPTTPNAPTLFPCCETPTPSQPGQQPTSTPTQPGAGGNGGGGAGGPSGDGGGQGGTTSAGETQGVGGQVSGLSTTAGNLTTEIALMLVGLVIASFGVRNVVSKKIS